MYIAVDKDGAIISYAEEGMIEGGAKVDEVPEGFFENYKRGYYKFVNGRISLNPSYKPYVTKEIEIDPLRNVVKENEDLKRKIAELEKRIAQDNVNLKLAIAELAEGL